MKRTLVVSAALLAVGCSAEAMQVSSEEVTPTVSPPVAETPTETETPAPDPVVMAAGDIACLPGDTVNDCHDSQTAALLAGADKVLTLGDNQYEDGVYTDFMARYDKSWGRFKSITKPSPGNHEYHTGGRGYFQYFNVPRWYSYNVGAWHLVSLNSQVSLAEGSEQNTWLERDLAANTAKCTLAYMHYPRYSGGKYYPGISSVKPAWEDLLRDRADVVLAGHDHNYQRFAPMNNFGEASPTGIRQFIAGTGGKNNYEYDFSRAVGLEYANGNVHGVLQLTLHANSYDWAFITEDNTVLDQGTDACR